MRNQEGKIELQKKVHGRIWVRDILFLATFPPSYVIFVAFFVYSLPFFTSIFLRKIDICSRKWWWGTGAVPVLAVSAAL